MLRSFCLAVLFSAGILSTQPACSTVYKTDGLYDGTGLAPARIEEVAARAEPGTVVIVSENHDFGPHHDKQVRVLEELARLGRTVSVGMEFFSYPVQAAVDRFVAGVLGEEEFLKEAGWGKNGFANYRRQVLFPRETGGSTVALNAPRALTGKIAKSGLASLGAEERAQLPPGFTLGRAEYLARFRETMRDHVGDEALARYFEAQSVWDDTMAWRAVEHLRRHPEEILVVIVGDFHAIYGGGLPDRLRARGAGRVLTISQVNLEGLSASEEREQVEPHPQWGSRADYVWVSRAPAKSK